MTTDVATTDRTELDEAFRALYLLPTAPRELVAAAYAVLANGSASSELRRAYETIVSAPDIDADFHLPRQTSPWELLHLRPDAPPSVMAAAYDLWRGDAEPIVFRPPVIDLVLPEGVEPRPIDSTAFISAFEELLGEPEEIEQPMAVEASSPPRVGDGLGEPDNFVYAFEELLSTVVDDPGTPLPWGEGLGVRAETGGQPSRHGHLTLIGADGTMLPLDVRPLRIGTQPSCDVVVRAAARVEARVWRNKGRVLVHALGKPGLVLVNGDPATWAVLTDGDTLAVGPASFSFRASELT